MSIAPSNNRRQTTTISDLTNPQDYRESRHHAKGLGKPNAIPTPDSEYARLGSADTKRRQACRRLFRTSVEEALIAAIRSATNGNYALGSERFQKQIEAALGWRAVRGTAGRTPRAVLAGDGQQRLL